MNEQMKKTFDSIGAFWGKLTKKTKVVIFICLGAAVLLAVITSAAMNRTQYTVLYSGLGSDEAQEITNELRTLSVDFKNENGTIYVDKNKENSVRMQLANEGYPKSAPNYDFFTKNVGVMTTDEERKIIEQYQLETRLGTIIKTMDAVDTAYVTITLPENSNYAWSDSKSAASASVALGLKSGKTLDAKQVNGIKQLVTKSVPNLKAENVTVMDTSSGDELTASSSSEASGSTQITLSEFKLKIEKQYEDNLQNKILNLLSQAYGRNNLSVSVKSKMDLDKKIQDIVTYTPSTSGGKGVVSHSTEIYETTRGSSAAGGVAGTQSNSDTTTTYPGVSVNGGVITTKDSRTYDYLVSKVQEQIQSDAAALDDLTVAVVVNTDSMTDAKKQEVTALVANAAAVDQSKVAVMAAAPASSAVSQPAQPANVDLATMLSNNKVILIAGGALLLLLILLIVLITAKRRNARREQLLANLQQTAPPLPLAEEAGAPEETADEEEAAEEGAETEEDGEAEEGGGAEEDAETEEGEASQGEEQSAGQTTEAEEETMPTESIEEIRNAADGKEQRVKNELKDFSDRNPEIAAQLIRSWLKGDDKKHG